MDLRLVLPPTPAYMNWGRWVAQCPGGCNCAMELERGQPEYDCRPAHAKSGRPCCAVMHGLVIWPEDAARVEEILARRPLLANRNWSPGETLDGLRAENLSHGVAP